MAIPTIIQHLPVNRNMLIFAPMDLQSEKQELANRILQTQDQALIGQIRALFNEQDKHEWENLPQHVREGIKRGLEQAANGQGTPHHEVMAKYKDYL